ncbi:MAG: YkvA family protein [Calditrichota bacterium]
MSGEQPKNPPIGELLRGALAGVGLEDTPENRQRYEAITEQIETQFNELRENATESDVLRVLDAAPPYIRDLTLSAKPLEKVVGQRADILYRLLRDSRFSAFEASWSTISAVTAALSYLLSESDVVPDALPVVGMFDDLLVVLLCSVLIRADLQRWAEAKQINLRDLGM